MSKCRFMGVFTACLMAFLSPSVQAERLQAKGFIEPLGFSVCMNGTHTIFHEFCPMDFEVVLSSSIYDLDQYGGRYLVVSGPGEDGSGGTCPVIDDVQTVCVPQWCDQPPQIDLQVFDGLNTWLTWSAADCLEPYDVIRGILPGPADNGTVTDLGPVICLVNDATTTSTFNGPRDSDVPPVGRAFFYAVRAGSRFLTTPYGYSSFGHAESPSSGDCSDRTP